MHTFIKRLIISAVLFGTVNAVQAQVAIYREFAMNDVASYTAALTNFYNALTGVEIPVTSLDVNVFDGDSPATHIVIQEFPDYASMEAFRNRAESQGVYLQFLSSLNTAATFLNSGLAVELGFWGERGANREYGEVIYVNTTDAQSYVEAFERYAQAISRRSPGPIGLYQNRAGWQGATHFVVYWAPTLTALNEFIDENLQSAELAEFLNDVGEIRTISTPVQRQNIMVWGR